MPAEELARALGQARREGLGWRCRCPLHGGRSLVVRDGDRGLILATCWGGCDRLDVIVELRRRGLLLSGRAEYVPRIVSSRPHGDEARRTARALKNFRATQPGGESVARMYLANRQIVLDQWPASLRFSPRCLRPRDALGNIRAPLPAMVALVERVGSGPVAVHCTYLLPDGSDKADLPKNEQRSCFGPVGGGAVRFGMPHAGEWLAVSEGVETGLSIAVACSMPAWAALSAGGIENLMLPPEATHIVICGDHDASGTGERAAHAAAARWLAEGRCVRIAIPPEVGTDFNDLLAGRAAFQINEVRDVI
jgi:putative DNA primase/helicase